MKVKERIFSFLCIGFYVLLLSNTACNKEHISQQLCIEDVDFSKNNWIKDKLEFYNWDYSDYPGEEDLISLVYGVEHTGQTYFQIEHATHGSLFYTCSGVELDSEELISALSVSTDKWEEWPIQYWNPSQGGGGGPW